MAVFSLFNEWRSNRPPHQRGETYKNRRKLQGTKGLLTEPDAALKVLESRIGTERIEPRPQEDAGIESLSETHLEPHHRLILVSQCGVDEGDIRSVPGIGARPVLQISKKVERFGSPA